MRQILYRLKYFAAMALFLLTSTVMSVGPAALSATAAATPPPPPPPVTSPLSYTGQGLPLDVQCDQYNTPYLLFIFSYGGNYSPTNVTLHGISVTTQTVSGHETHFTTSYADPTSLKNTVNVSWSGEVGNGAQLVISHGCPGSEELTPVTPVAPSTTEPNCEVTSETVTPFATTGILWTPSTPTVLTPGQHVTYVASADTGYVLAQGAQASFTVTNNFNVESCDHALTPVTPVAPSTTEPNCEVTSETVTPFATTGILWTPSTPTVLTPGQHVTYVASADTGYVLAQGAQASFTVTNNFNIHTCDTTSVTLCHATDSRKNPYVKITVDASGAYNGHYTQHDGPVFSPLLPKHTKWGDIIPQFTYNGQTYSLNAVTGASILDNDCNVSIPKPKHVIAAPVTFKDITCDENGSYTVPETDHVTYKDAQGNVIAAGTYTVSANQTVSITAYADAGYTLKGTHHWTHSFTVPENCQPPCDEDESDVSGILRLSVVNHEHDNDSDDENENCITPAEVTFTDATCENPALGSYTIPTSAHVVYKVNGQVVAAGTHNVSVPGTVTVTAYPASNTYTLTGTTTWSHDFSAPEGCGGGGGHVLPPTVVVTPSACVAPALQPTGSVTVTVTNPNLTKVTYTITIGITSQQLTLEGGAHGSVTFNGLGVGSYIAHVTGDDDTSVTANAVTLAACPVTPGSGGGHVLGETTSATTAVLADTGANTVLPTILALSLALTATGVMFGSRKYRNQIAVTKNDIV